MLPRVRKGKHALGGWLCQVKVHIHVRFCGKKRVRTIVENFSCVT